MQHPVTLSAPAGVLEEWVTALHLNITDNLTLRLTEAGAVAQNRSCWKLLASHRTTHLYCHSSIIPQGPANRARPCRTYMSFVYMSTAHRSSSRI